MLYHVTIGARTLAVELTDDGVSIDGVPAGSAELMSLPGGGVHHLLHGSASHAFLAKSQRGGVWDLHMAGRRLTAEVVDERTRAIRALTRATAGPTGPRPVRAPMPGMIVRVEVTEGDAVRPGQGIVIMEAMKMENELKAEAPGVVARIMVKAGQAVEKGMVLVEFRSEDAPHG